MNFIIPIGLQKYFYCINYIGTYTYLLAIIYYWGANWVLNFGEAYYYKTRLPIPSIFIDKLSYRKYCSYQINILLHDKCFFSIPRYIKFFLANQWGLDF